MTTTKATKLIILAEGRGDYITGLSWERDGKPSVEGGSAADAIRYTPEEARELLASLGRGFSAEPAPIPKLRPLEQESLDHGRDLTRRLNAEATKAKPTPGLISVALAAASECEALGYDGTSAVRALPELLRALEKLLPLATDARCIQSVKWTSARDVARAALAAAKGDA